jgi:DNA mismatch repair ATPase MutL
VKFEDEQLIFSCVKKAVLESLKLNNLVPELVGDSPMNFTSLEEVKFQNENGKEESVIIDKITGEVYDVNRYNNSKFNSLRYNKLVGNSNNNDYHRHNFSNDNYKNSPILNSSLNKLYQPASNELDDTKSNNNIEINTNHYNEDIQNQFQLEIINSDINNNVWQLHNKYIFLQTEDGLLAIDQHNAHERVIYEKLISKINNDISANNIAKQNLLFPITIKINNLQLLAIKEIQNELERIGFSFEISNTDNYNTITIFAQPSDINIGTAENSFLELIDDYLQNEELKHFKKQERICATVACKSAIKAGKKLSQEEMSNIAYELSKCNMPHICPHGRPIIIHSLLTEWDRKFGRI